MLSMDETRFYVAQTVLALEAIHKHNYIHRCVFMNCRLCLLQAISDLHPMWGLGESPARRWGVDALAVGQELLY